MKECVSQLREECLGEMRESMSRRQLRTITNNIHGTMHRNPSFWSYAHLTYCRTQSTTSRRPAALDHSAVDVISCGGTGCVVEQNIAFWGREEVISTAFVKVWIFTEGR